MFGFPQKPVYNAVNKRVDIKLESINLMELTIFHYLKSLKSVYLSVQKANKHYLLFNYTLQYGTFTTQHPFKKERNL